MSWNKFKLLSIWVSWFILKLVTTCQSCLHQGKKAAWSGLQKNLRFGEHHAAVWLKLRICKTLIHPHLEYNVAPVWAPPSYKSIANLEKVQRFGLKLCLKSWDDSYYNHLTRVLVLQSRPAD